MPYLQANQENVSRAKAFLSLKWKERASELGRPEPTDLSTACKFASAFAQAIFGGRIKGNKNHQYLELPDGNKLDLTDNNNFELKHDPSFFGNPEHQESMKSVKPRVDAWVREFTGNKIANEITFSLGDFMRQGVVKVAMPLPELVKETNNFSTKNSPGCVAKLTSSKPSDLFLEYNVKCDLKTSDPAGHTVRIRFDTSQVTDETKANKLDVQASCSCPAFLYWGAQWALHQRDSLEGEPRPLLTAPTERLDLRGKFVLCKHVYTVSSRILPAVQNNINTILRKRRVEEAKPVETPDRLKGKQEEMRKRQELKKLRDKRNKTIQKKLLDGVRKREEEKPNVITRDEPSTPEEKAKVPNLVPEPILSKPKPSVAPSPKSVVAPKPKDVVKRDPVPATLSDSDRKNMEKLRERENAKKLLESVPAEEVDDLGNDNDTKKERSSLEKLMDKERKKIDNGDDTDRDEVQ